MYTCPAGSRSRITPAGTYGKHAYTCSAARRGAAESSGTPDRRALGAGPVAHHNCPPKTARRTRSAVTGVSAHAAGVARRKGYLGLVTTAAWLPPWKTL